MILYHFPPIGGISMSRNVRNVQYLPEHGWEPVPLTPRDIVEATHDPGSLAMIPPEIEVRRTGAFETRDIAPAIRLARRVLAAAAAVRATGSEPRQPGEPGVPTEMGGEPGSRPVPPASGPAPSADADVLTRIRRLAFFPDNQVGWLPFALAGALRAHREAAVDVVYSTFPPMTSHVVARLFRAITGVPWVAEFRDPWIGNALEAPPPWFIRQARRKVERWVVRGADRVVAVTPRLAGMLERRYPGLDVVLVPNGYDRTATPAPKREPGGPFRIVYTGTLDRPTEFRTFLEGLDLMAHARPDLRDRITIDLYGVASDACRAIAAGRAAGDAPMPAVHLHGFVSKARAVEAIRDADAALVLLGDGPNMDLFMPGKLLEYLGLGRRILAMLPPGDARDLLERLDWGVLAEPTAPSVAEALARLVDTPPPTAGPDPEGLYDRRRIASVLAGVLDAAADANLGVPA